MVRFSSDGGRRYLRVEGARPLQDVPQAASLPAARHEVYRRRVCHVSISSVREAVFSITSNSATCRYVREEFRRHKDVNGEEGKIFLQAWTVREEFSLVLRACIVDTSSVQR